MGDQPKDSQQVPGGGEELLRRFIESMPAAIAMFDRDMRYLAASSRWKSDHHLDSASLNGASHYDIFPDIPERWKAVHRRGLAGESVRCDEDRFDRTDGTVQWLRWELKPWHAPDGSVGGVTIFAEDISARKIAEEALRESEARLRISAKSANVGFWDWDLVTNEVYADPEWKSRIGYSEEANSNYSEQWRSRLHPDDLEPTLLKLNASISTPQLHYDVEYRLRHKDGLYRWINAQGEVERDVAGKPVRMRGCHIDVTARKQTEAKASESQALLRAVMEGTTDAVYVKDLLGCYRFFNGAATRMVGKSADEVFGRDDVFVFGAKDGRAVMEGDRKVLSAGKAITYEERITFPAGEKLTFLSTKGPVVDAEGKVVGIFGIARDITDLTRKTEMIAGLNSCFLGFGTDHMKNIGSLVGFLGAFSGASFAVYSRLEGEALVTATAWNLPREFASSGSFKGRVGLDLLADGGGGSVLIKDLPKTKYAKTDPWILRLGQRTFLGIRVGRGSLLVGILWLSYREDIEPGQDTLELVGIVAAAVSGVEARLQAFEEVRRSERILKRPAWCSRRRTSP